MGGNSTVKVKLGSLFSPYIFPYDGCPRGNEKLKVLTKFCMCINMSICVRTCVFVYVDIHTPS